MAHPYFKRKQGYAPRVSTPPVDELGIVVVIPAFNEPNLWPTLQSLMDCHPTQCAVEVLVVVNYPEGSDKEVAAQAHECVGLVNHADRIKGDAHFRLFPIDATNLPKKHAGVGLARRIGMDEAAWRLLQSKSHLQVVSCFDADATCSNDYLVELEKLWRAFPDTEACSIRYEHPTEGDEFDHRIYHGITQYELHLRCYVQAGKYVGHPFSYHTVGSSMACSADAYMRYGGMNRNKAGEDFYFLQKIIPHGKFKALNTCCVYPSPRPSHRVPFGTGRAITMFVKSQDENYRTYSPEAWLALKPFFDNIHELYRADAIQCQSILSKQELYLREFLTANRFRESIAEINANTSSLQAFQKRFFLWFDGFMLLKYHNFAAENYLPRVPVAEVALRLANMLGIPCHENMALEIDLLMAYRQWEYS